MKIDIYEHLAIIIDLEGCINVARSTENKGHRHGIHYYIRMDIINTNKEILEHIKNKIKFGKIINSNRGNEKHKNNYKLHFNQKETKELLPKILPFLIIKWQQAELAIEMLSILKDRKYSSSLSKQDRGEMYTYEEWCTFDFIYRECKKLNQRGPS